MDITEALVEVAAIVALVVIMGLVFRVKRQDYLETITCSCGSSMASPVRRRIDEFERRHRDCVALDAAVKAGRGRQHV